MRLTLTARDIPREEKIPVICDQCQEPVHQVSREGMTGPWLCEVCRLTPAKEGNE